MVRRKSRSRSRGREEGYLSDDATTVRPFKPVKKGKVKSAKKPIALHYKEGEEVMARWPGSRLYYSARVQLVRPDDGEYDVEYENGVIFTLTAKDVYKPGGSAKKSSRRAKVDSANSSDSGAEEKEGEAEVTEDEDITSKLVKVSNSSKKISNGSFKEPTLLTRTSTGSKTVRVSSSSRSSRQEAGPVTDVFSDDEELLSVSQRPSVSSVNSQSKKVSSSSKLSKLNRVSFSSTINRLLDNVFINKTHTNGVIEENGNDHETQNATNEGSEQVSKISEVSDGEKHSSKDLNVSTSSLRLDEFSEDELDESKNEKFAVASPMVNQNQPGRLDWLVSLLFMILGPVILVTLHNVCTANLANLSVPSLSLHPGDYLDKEATIIVMSFMFVLRFCEFVCIGKTVEGHRMNGFQTLLICLLSIPGLLAHDISVEVVQTKYFYLMTSSLLLALLLSTASYLLSLAFPPPQLSKAGSSGNPLSDLYHGRPLNPTLTGCNLKLQTFRFSMIGLALLNLGLVTQSLLELGGRPNMAVIVTASLQVLYAMDAMFYEKYYFNSTDFLNSGYGWSLVSSYMTFPFLPTLATKYIIHTQPDISPTVLVVTGLLNLLGYVIYRSSETQRCELATNPTNPELANLETIEGLQGRKVIVSGWWSLVRHPTYLGELIIQWSWVLPLGCSLGVQFLTPYYLPVITTLMLGLRCLQTNNNNRRKFGSGWEDYSRRVRANMIPYVF